MNAVRHNLPYDPDVHVTAGQLRRLGFYLSEMLPDTAYVRRVAVGLDVAEPLEDGSATLRLDVLEPFAVREPDRIALAA